MRDPRSRIRKLLDLAHDQEGTPEGTAAARLARQMMLRHAIDLEGLDHETRRQRDPVDRLEVDLGGRELWRRRLSASVGHHANCTVAWPERGGRAVYFGHRSDLLIAEYLTVVLSRQVEESRAGFAQDLETDEDGAFTPDSRRLLRDYCHSAITAIEGRLKHFAAQVDGELPEATALIRSRGDEVERWLKERGIKFRKAAPSPYRYHHEGYQAGHAIPLHEGVHAEVRGELPRG